MTLSTIIIALKVGPLLLAAGYALTYLLRPSDQRLFRDRIMWVMPGLFYLALLTPWLPLFLIVMIGVLPALARTRGEAAALFVVASAGMPPLFMSVNAGSAFIFQPSVYHSLGVGLLIASFTSRGGGRTVWGWRDLPIAIFFLISAFAQARGLNFTSTGRELLGVVLLIAVPYVAIRRCVTTAADVRLVLMAFCFAAGVQSVLALYEMATFWPVYNTLFDHFDIPNNFTRWIKIRGGLMRAHGALPESTSFGWFLAIAMTITLATRRAFPTQTKWGAMLLLISAGMYASGARVGWLAVAIGFIAISLVRRRYGTVFAGVVAAVAGYAAINVIARATGLFGNLLGLTGDGAGTVEYRKQLFNRGVEEFYKYPLTGRPLAEVRDALIDLQQGEGIIDFVNTYVFFGLTTGVFGVILFALMFPIAMYSAWTAAKLANRTQALPLENLAVATFAVSAFSMVTAFTSGFGGGSVVYYIVVAGALASQRSVLAHTHRAKKASRDRPLINVRKGDEPKLTDGTEDSGDVAPARLRPDKISAVLSSKQAFRPASN